MADDSERNRRAMRLLMERGVISSDKSLSDLVRISEELASLPGGGGDSEELKYWEYISPNYVWRGWEAEPVKKQETIAK